MRVSKQWLQYWLVEHHVDAAGVPFYIPMGSRKKFEAVADHRRLVEKQSDEQRSGGASSVCSNLPVACRSAIFPPEGAKPQPRSSHVAGMESRQRIRGEGQMLDKFSKYVPAVSPLAVAAPTFISLISHAWAAWFMHFASRRAVISAESDNTRRGGNMSTPTRRTFLRLAGKRLVRRPKLSH